ncbi:hypothetical protein E2C01_038290 [Portunus trituberculatus]|uniref:Uncharacterized protein n=1 Tax=Portunus trituberculatus TaxID=210409 RepID=A0A5B7FHM6_PORTR|nr:hypothetical protein [Portunus trituberculatus]
MGFFSCIPPFYAPNLRSADKTHYLYKELKYVKKWVISRFMHQTQKCRKNTIFVKTSYLCVFQVIYEKKLSQFKILLIRYFTMFCFKTIKFMKTS